MVFLTLLAAWRCVHAAPYFLDVSGSYVMLSLTICYCPSLLLWSDNICIVTFMIMLEEFCRKYWFLSAGTSLMARLWFPLSPRLNEYCALCATSFGWDADWHVSDMQSWTHLLSSQLSKFCCCFTKIYPNSGKTHIRLRSGPPLAWGINSVC